MTAIGVGTRPARPPARSGALGLLRSTGAAGIASAVVIAVATVLAAFGPLLAPYNPDLPSLRPGLDRAVRRPPARLRL